MTVDGSVLNRPLSYLISLFLKNTISVIIIHMATKQLFI